MNFYLPLFCAGWCVGDMVSIYLGIVPWDRGVHSAFKTVLFTAFVLFMKQVLDIHD